MNPFSVGSPIDDIIITMKIAAYTGITFERPPYSAISRVWRRS